MKKILLGCFLMLFLGACTHGNCRAQQKKTEVPMADSSLSERIKVCKSDGSLQCGQGQKISLEDMQKQLKGINVYSSFNKNDGLMRIQVCGAPTGNHNVYEIDRKNLEAALKAGFKEWTFE